MGVPPSPLALPIRVSDPFVHRRQWLLDPRSALTISALLAQHGITVWVLDQGRATRKRSRPKVRSLGDMIRKPTDKDRNPSRLSQKPRPP
jgi:hypothetical protein